MSRGLRKKVSQLREILNSNVKAIFPSTKPHIVRGVLEYGRNSVDNNGFHFTPVSVTDAVSNRGSQDKSEGYYITRDEKNLPALRLYKREIIVEEEFDEEEGLPVLKVVPELCSPRREEHGFHPAYIGTIYPTGGR